MKTIEEIYSEMLNLFVQHTGLDVSANDDLAVRFYAVAAQIHGLYLQAAWTEKQCFPQTAAGEYLDYHAQLRGVERKHAAKASGKIRFSVEQPAQSALTIPAGTICMTAGLVSFETTEEGILPEGASYADVSAVAVEEGKAGNIAAGTVTLMSVAPVGIAACTNPEAFRGGSDQETDEQLRTRILDTYRRLSNGANAAFYKRKALEFEEVTAAVVVPRSRGIGTVDVVVASREGVPQTAVCNKIQACFDEMREIAVDVQVLAPETLAVDVAIMIKAAQGYDEQMVREKVRNVLTDYFDGSRLGKNVLLAELGAVVYGIEGVENYAFSSPAADIEVEETVLPVLGTLAVEAMS